MRRALTGLAGALALTACSTAPPRVGEPPPHVADAQAEQQYRSVYERWTKGTELYDLLDARMFLAATEQSPEFVTARSARMAEFEAMPPPDAQAYLARELADAAQGYGFFVGVHTADSRVNDLDRPSTVWRLALASSAGEVTPVSVERVSRLNANLRGVYLFLGDFWVGYRVRFPAALPNGQPLVAPGEKEVQLKLDSAIGHARLTFPAVAMAVAPAAPSLAPDAGAP